MALDNARHERFAQELAKGRSATEAYATAGYSPDRGAASRLSANVSVQARVAELQERAAARTELTVASATDRLLKIADKGEAMGGAAGLSVSRAAIMDAAKLNGLVVDKSEVKADVEVTDARERLARIVAGHIAASGAVESPGQPH